MITTHIFWLHSRTSRSRGPAVYSSFERSGDVTRSHGWRRNTLIWFKFVDSPKNKLNRNHNPNANPFRHFRANFRHLCSEIFHRSAHVEKQTSGRDKFVQLVAGCDQSNIQSIGANWICFMNAERIARWYFVNDPFLCTGVMRVCAGQIIKQIMI